MPNELKPEDVMEEAECCGYATGCTDCVLANYDGSPCIVKKALALLREKDAEIERLKLEYAGFEGATKQIFEALRDEADRYKRYYYRHDYDEMEAEIRAKVVTEFAERVKSEVNGGQFASYKGLEIRNVIDQIAKEMKEEQK